MIPFEYVDRRGDRVVSDWSLEKQQRVSLNVWLVRIRRFDREMAINTQIFPCRPLRGVYYVKIRGRVQLRPRVCLGPVDPDQEVTFLERVSKKGGRETPDRRSSRAPERYLEVRRSPDRRRRALALSPAEDGG